ncbi:MAG TPA: hypothetical protein VNW92_14485 [Polyangiaceae bacterium]|jgi:hypothetical protein|nr:hypothetical protein [Polyangiaceae bacterium]
MTAAHIIFIPGILLVGIALGYSLGARAVRAEMTRLRRRTKE